MQQSTTRPAFLDPVFVTQEEWEQAKERQRIEAHDRQYTSAPFPDYVRCPGYRDCQRWLSPDEAREQKICSLCRLAEKAVRRGRAQAERRQKKEKK